MLHLVLPRNAFSGCFHSKNTLKVGLYKMWIVSFMYDPITTLKIVWEANWLWTASVLQQESLQHSRSPEKKWESGAVNSAAGSICFLGRQVEPTAVWTALFPDHLFLVKVHREGMLKPLLPPSCNLAMIHHSYLSSILVVLYEMWVGLRILILHLVESDP